MPASTSETDRSRRLEHGAIGPWLDSIEDRLARMGEVELLEEKVAQILEELEQLSRGLVQHFEHEEAPGGVFARARTAAPRLDRRLRALLRQHAPLGADLAQVLEDAGYAGMAPEAWRRVADGFAAFAHALRAHEQEEDRVIAAAHLDEMGSGD